MNPNQYRKLYKGLHGKYERTFTRRFQTAIRKDIRAMNLSTIDRYNYVTILQFLQMPNFERALRDLYTRAGNEFGSIDFNYLQRNVKRNNPFFSQIWQNFIVQQSAGLIGQKVTTIKTTLINDLSKLISNEIEQQLENQTTFFDIAKKINTFVNQPTFYDWQSLRIARTETTTASNLAKYVSGQEAQKLGIVIQKRWLSAGDGNERESHAELNGTTAPMNGRFANGLLYPGDQSGGDASEVVNCRCTYLNEPISVSDSGSGVRIALRN